MTVKLKAVPAVAAAGAETTKWLAALEVTLTLAAPVIAGHRIGGGDRLEPDVFSVTEKVPAPLVKVLLAGSTAGPSLLVKCTVPT